MRVDGSLGIGPHDVAEAARGMLKQAPPPASDRGGPGTSGGSEVIVSEAAYIRAALDGGDVDRAAVERARRLLASGELDTPEAARRAAEAILTRGA